MNCFTLGVFWYEVERAWPGLSTIVLDTDSDDDHDDHDDEHDCKILRCKRYSYMHIHPSIQYMHT